MKIQSHGSVNGAQIIKVYKKAEKVTSKTELASDVATDSIEISETGKQIARLQKLAAEIPDVRTDLVRRIKQQIKTNSYQVSAEKLAEKLYEEIVKDRN